MTSRLLFAAIADDDTGASDLAGMLAEQGVRTLLVIALPTLKQFEEWSAGYHAAVLAAGTRNLPPAEASERTRAALRIVAAREPRVYQIKYCSTFDSTPEGNIGPTIDAALDALAETFTVALPALPINERTTYQGYHFVKGQLLSDSPMRHHPLTPMTNPNLVDLLGQQTTRRVGLARYETVAAGADELEKHFRQLRAEGVAIAVLDCLSEAHLRTICRAAADLRLVTGSSAFGTGLPSIWRERGWVEQFEAKTEAPPASHQDKGALVVAGSCSVATRCQNVWLAKQGAQVFRVEPRALLEADFGRAALVAQVRAHLLAGRHCLLTTTDEPAEVARVQEWAAERGMSVPALGQAIAHALARVVAEILIDQPARGLVVAGGETSGAVCRRLNLGALRVGRNIEPGVPLCYSLGALRLPVVLKSGNFGARTFYGKALDALSQPGAYLI